MHWGLRELVSLTRLARRVKAGGWRMTPARRSREIGRVAMHTRYVNTEVCMYRLPSYLCRRGPVAGTIPQELGDLVNLKELLLHSNSLEGTKRHDMNSVPVCTGGVLSAIHVRKCVES